MSMFFALILGLPLGTGIALFLVGKMLNKSNNFGDSKCCIHDVSKEGMCGKDYQDKIKRDIPLRGITNPVILEHMTATNIASVGDMDDSNHDHPN